MVFDPLKVICYFVYRIDGGWTVSFDHHSGLLTHANKESALRAARDAAEARWLVCHRASCVRIGSPDGESVLDCTFGGSLFLTSSCQDGN